MSDFNESARAAATSQHWADAAALRSLSLDQKIRFTRYVRKVLPLDGFVFWLKEDERDFEGSLFHDTVLTQNEDETVAQSTMTFTCLEPIQEFERVDPNTLWVGTFDDRQFAFSRLAQFYDAAGIWMYTGLALQAAVSTQLIDSRQGIDDRAVVVSNSLPAWLRLVTYTPIWLQTPNPGIVLYPSFVVPQNLRPPYGAVHIYPELTRSMQGAPYLGIRASHWLLATDTVDVTLYGVDNDTAMDFIDLVNQFSVDNSHLGIMNMPIVVDEKRTQPEMSVIAMKKTIRFEVSYNQHSMRDIARQMITSAAVAFPEI